MHRRQIISFDPSDQIEATATLLADNREPAIGIEIAELAHERQSFVFRMPLPVAVALAAQITNALELHDVKVTREWQERKRRTA